jgi:hypothetical protein
MAAHGKSNSNERRNYSDNMVDKLSGERQNYSVNMKEKTTQLRGKITQTTW